MKVLVSLSSPPPNPPFIQRAIVFVGGQCVYTPYFLAAMNKLKVQLVFFSSFCFGKIHKQICVFFCCAERQSAHS